VGKSFIASALAQKACRDGHSALYLRAAALLRELALARADGSLRHFLARLGRIDVLVIDDWAIASLNENERREVWEICEDRYQTRSTILTSPVASLALARADRRSHYRRRHPRPLGAQRSSHRDARWSWQLFSTGSLRGKTLWEALSGQPGQKWPKMCACLLLTASIDSFNFFSPFLEIFWKISRRKLI
jgi:hypothetical protein